MSSAMKQPVGQKLLTNVAIVRYKAAGIRFEIACYKNKVLSWRTGVEKDIDEVLQIDQVFANVGKGVKAKPADMQKAFSTTDHASVCKIILEKGELQLSEKEREHHLEQMFRDVVHIVADKCVDPDTQRPVTTGVVEKMMREAHIAVSLNQTAKMQALETIKQLEGRFPIKRAAMRIRLSVAGMHLDAVRSKLTDLVLNFEPSADENSLVMLIAPGKFREVDTFVSKQLKGCSLEVLNMAVQEAQETSLHAADGLIDDEACVIIAPSHAAMFAAGGGGGGGGGGGASGMLMGGVTAGMGGMLLGAASATGAGRLGGGGGGGAAAAATGASLTDATPASKKLGCNTCNGAKFADPKQHREHFKSEWHRYNLKRKVDGQDAVDEGLFNQLALLEPHDRKDFF